MAEDSRACVLKEYTIFIDDLQTYESGTLEWRMHYDGEIKDDSKINGQSHSTYTAKADDEESEFISIQNRGLETRLYPLYPKDQSISIGDGLRDGEMLSQRGMRDPDRVNRQFGSLPVGHFLSLTSKMNGKRANLIEAIRRPFKLEDAEHKSTFAPTIRELDDAIEILIPAVDGTTEHILVNTRADGSFMHKNSWQNIGTLRTDAFIVYQKRNNEGKLIAAGMINGSRLRIGDEFAIGSLLKFDGFFDLATRTAHVQTSMETELAIDSETQTNLDVSKGDSILSF